jgi:hypothetical protein
MDEHDLPLDGWYRLAAALVRGVKDDAERAAWRQWAHDRGANAAHSPLRTTAPTDLWHGEPKRGRRCNAPMGRTSRTDFGKTAP